MPGTYPEDEELEKIKNWDAQSLDSWFMYIKTLWSYTDWGWKEESGEYHISTGGWSGNEEIIDAMESNHIAWLFTWVQSRRGGHYIFEKNRFAKKADDPDIPSGDSDGDSPDDDC